jgi:hypothetical protein
LRLDHEDVEVNDSDVSATLNFSTPLRLLSKIHEFLSVDGGVFLRTFPHTSKDLSHSFVSIGLKG